VIYFDHNASAPLHPAVLEEMRPWLMGTVGNASSRHHAGRTARTALETARQAVAAAIAGEAEQLIFTSGGTEANQLAILAALRVASARREIVTSRLEHPSVLDTVADARPFAVKYLPVGADGVIADAGVGAQTALVCLQWANHELGTLQPVLEMAERCRLAGAWLHVDAVQALGKVAIDVRKLSADSVSFSAHKIGGPQGVGALYVKRGFVGASGGHQERSRRPGTENLAGIVGFGCAARLLRVEDAARVEKLRDRLEAGLIALGARVHGRSARVGNTSNIGFDGVDGELLMESLDLAGVAVSVGAACSSGSVEPSAVLLALGLPKEKAREAVRFSLGPSSTDDEVARVLEIVPPILQRIRAA
jgi:cysteine desulfurase